MASNTFKCSVIGLADVRVSSLQCGLSNPAESSSTPESIRWLLVRSSLLRLEDWHLRIEDRAPHPSGSSLQLLSLKKNKRWRWAILFLFTYRALTFTAFILLGGLDSFLLLTMQSSWICRLCDLSYTSCRAGFRWTHSNSDQRVSNEQLLAATGMVEMWWPV